MLKSSATVIAALALFLTGSADGIADPIRVKNGKFVDTSGREVFFRGVNVVYKDPPYLPTVPSFHANLSFVEDDVKLLASVGVNLLRLGVMWPGVSPFGPSRAERDKSYIENIRSMIRLAAKYGIYSILDPHQDEFNPRFCGEGAPDWWVEKHNASVEDFPVPVQSTPFPVNPTPPNFPGRKLCDTHSSFSYIWTHAASRAYQKLWDDAKDYASFWSILAEELGSEPAVIGGELWNEPFPGAVFDNATYRQNHVADLDNLQPFYEVVTKSIREMRPQASSAFAIAYEPSWPVGDQEINPTSILPSTSGFSALPEDDAIYAFHWYVAPCDPNLTRYLDARLEDAKRLRAVPYASEWNFGAWSVESADRFAGNIAAFETRKISYTGWQYKSYQGSLPNGTCTGCGNSFFWNNGSLNVHTMSGLRQPFAQRVAGVDVEIKSSFATMANASSATYELTYNVTVWGGATVVIVPDLLWKDRGLALTVSASTGTKAVVSHPGFKVTEGVEVAGYAEVHLLHSEVDVGKVATLKVIAQ